MIKTTRSLLRLQAAVLTAIGLILGGGFARQSLLSKWEQEAHYRAAIVDSTVARFRSDLLRGYTKDIQIALQDLSHIVGTKQFSLSLANGLTFEIRAPFTSHNNAADRSLCVANPSKWRAFFSESRCSFEHSVIFYDADRRHHLADVTWTVARTLDRAILIDLIRNMIFFVLLAILIAYFSSQIFEKILIVPLSNLTKQLGSAAEKMSLGLPFVIEPYGGRVVTEVKILTDTSTRHIEQIQALQLSLADALVYRAIADTTAMVAHDIRRPFSLLKTYLGMLARVSDVASYQKIAAKVVPEIDRSLGVVNGMLADLSEVRSSPKNLVTQNVSPRYLLEVAMIDAFRHLPKDDVRLDVCLSHRHLVAVDVGRVGRVFANIIGNALQAMNGRAGAVLWFRTVDRPNYVEFCIGNSASLIPSDDLCRIFDSYFTNGKKGGTGLGLAIAKKVVEAHGGDIYCVSARDLVYPDGYVEFRLTLPKVDVLDTSPEMLVPRNSSELVKGISVQSDGEMNGCCDQMAPLNAKIILPSVAIVEDNIFMLEAWIETLSADALVLGFLSPEELFKAMDVDPELIHSLACVVTDFHFDNSNQYDGIDVGKVVKSRTSHARVLLATDYDDGSLELASAFDHVISKVPASFAELALRFGISAANA